MTYKEGGPAAAAAFEAGVAGVEARAFRGCGIFTSGAPRLGPHRRACAQAGVVRRAEPFEVSDDQDSVQMLTRSTQIGEFYVMSPPQVNPGNGKCQFTCDLLLYDEESDRHVRITWQDARDACCVGPAATPNDANLIDGDTVLVNAPAAGNTADYWNTVAGRVTALNASAGDGWALLTAATDIDCRIVVARPFIEHLMHSVIICVSGRDTGATLFGPADMQLSANTQVKTIEGHYTGHFKAVITKPQNVLVMRDVACAGYVAGCNTQWFAKRYGAGGGGGMSLATAQTEMMKRLSFADDIGAKYSSMLAFPCWAGQFESGHLDTVMSVTTRLLPWEVTTATGGTHQSFPGGPGAYAQYSTKLNLRSIHFGEDMKAAENQDFISQGSTNNATCFLGPHRKFDPFTKSFMSLIPGQGHFGPDAIPGDARWRRGESVSLKTARDAMVGLELAQHAQMVYSKA